MEDNELQYLTMLQQKLEQEQIANVTLQNSQSKMQGISSQDNANLISYQLELEKEIDRIKHLLSGHVMVSDRDGNTFWSEPKDDRMKILSDYGVDQIMNLISFYINKNTLLSNYDEDTINWKIKDFGMELSDLIFCRYEAFFYYPKPEELYEQYIPYVTNGTLSISAEKLYEKCVQWSQEELKSKIRHYPMIILSLIDSVHSTYLRAYRGQERESLRKFMHVSQNTNPMPMQQPVSGFSIFKPTTWGGKK